MISVSEAKTLINENTVPLNPVTIALEKASGHILAKAVYATYDIPAFMQSSMDGYAIKYDDHNFKFRLVGVMAAGTNKSIKVNPGETIRIFTGAPVPEAADTVVMQEKIKLEDGLVHLHDRELNKGSNVRDKGSEISAGSLAMSAGNLLSPAAIGFLAGIGLADVTVFPMPKIAIVITGNELQQPGRELDFGQVYESNSYSLSAALKFEGIDEIRTYHAADDLQLLTNTLRNSLESADVVLLTGGVSVGDYDFVAEASTSCGVKQIFHKIKQKPGKPLYFGTKGRKLVFGLPGNPSSVLSCYYNYVLPAIKLLSNKENSTRETIAELATTCKKSSGLTHFLKAVHESGKATPLNAQESYKLSSFAQANCLICLEEEQTDFYAGQAVKVLLLPG